MAKTLTDQAFLKLVNEGNIPSLSFWIGEEDYLKTTALVCLKTEAQLRHWSLEEYSCNDEKPSKVIGRVTTTSFLGSRFLFIFRDADRCASSERAFLESFSEKMPQDTLLVLIASAEMPNDDPFFEKFSGRAVIVEFNSLEGQQLNHWIVERASKFNLKLDDRIIKVISSHFGKRLLDIAAFIEKLALWNLCNQPLSEQIIQDLLINSHSEFEGLATSVSMSGNFSNIFGDWAHLRLWGMKPEVYISKLFYSTEKILLMEDNLELLYATDLAFKTGAAPEQVLMPLTISKIVHPDHRLKKEEEGYG